jgi:glutamine synthetase
MPHVTLEYIWLDASNEFRSKTKIMKISPAYNTPILDYVPMWNYDGSSTGQATGTDSEVFLKPVVLFRDPFRDQDVLSKNANYLVWCDVLDKNNVPLKNSFRQHAVNTFTKYSAEKPWFGLEQEYFIIDPETDLPLGFTSKTNPEPQGKYYCGVGAKYALGRIVSETHLKYCLYAGIKICGINGEVAPAQWEYQIGPCEGIEAGDHLWVSRYILNRVAESFNYNISYHPKPLGIDTDWNGSGCHTNFSTELMRENYGINHINRAITRLSNNHYAHMLAYGEHNRMRMSGKHETSSYSTFTVGRANRGASIRIPNQVLTEAKGYFEDRRPAANCDPYLVTELIMNTCMDVKYDNVVPDLVKASGC